VKSWTSCFLSNGPHVFFGIRTRRRNWLNSLSARKWFQRSTQSCLARGFGANVIFAEREHLALLVISI
jgi:hypothetical protein